jgi:hypothetical protein
MFKDIRAILVIFEFAAAGMKKTDQQIADRLSVWRK